MTPPSYGATSREPVYSGNRRIPGLWKRTKANGAVVYEARQHLGGRLRRVSLKATTKTDAIAEQRRLAVDYERGEPSLSPAAALTLADLSADWLTHLESRTRHRDPRQRRSPRTIELNRQRLSHWILPDLGYLAPNDLTVTHLRRLIDKMTGKGLAPSTVTGTINIISSLLQWTVRNGHATRNVVRDLDRNDRPGSARLTEPRYLTDTEIQLLLSKMGDTFRPVAATFAYAGLRVSEALGLRWRDLDLKNDTLTVSGQLGPDGERVPVKTPSSAATIPMLPALKRELKAHRARQARRDRRQRPPRRTRLHHHQRPPKHPPCGAPRRQQRRHSRRTQQRRPRTRRPTRPPTLRSSASPSTTAPPSPKSPTSHATQTPASPPPSMAASPTTPATKSPTNSSPEATGNEPRPGLEQPRRGR